MKVRFPIWLACIIFATFVLPTAAFAQRERRDPPTRRDSKPETRPTAKRPDAKTDREKEREREAAESRRAKEREQPHTRPHSHAHPHRHDARARRLHDAMDRRERLLRERRLAERRDVARWVRLRNERALARRREIYYRWAFAVRTPEGRAEFELYSQRKARLNRIRDIASERNDNAMIVRTDRVIVLENARHANVLTLLVSKQ